VVVSPHLDDAVLSCAGLLAARPGGRVVTAYTAGPAAWEGLTSWDERCGFRAGVDVMAVRKQEDRSALALLGAEPVWLDLTEGQYEPRPGPAEVTDRLRQHLTTLHPAPVTLAVPLGLDHPDHVTVSDAVLALRREGVLPDATWLLYEDLPYATRSPGVAVARREALRADGLVLEAVPATELDLVLKRAAVARYRTQIRPLWSELPLRSDQEVLWRLR
jgi:LmbE family N-acetylglucosaminyl deacetylase